ncbi:MAG TPA: hypothetical protein VKR31_05940 [Rhizomicrobium sp.]|nr:hypothetical protein [Rhizomicrobium sp.]
MTVYRLQPILPDHPSWETSSHWFGPLWVEADSEIEAREKVRAATDMGISTGESPWDLPEVTSCVPDNSRRLDPDAGVMRQDGQYLDVDLDPDPDDDDD